MKETPITNKILKYLNSLPRCKATKRHTGYYGRVGEPDITGCKSGQRFEIETKRPGKEPTPIQFKRLKEWFEAGAKTYWTDNTETLTEVSWVLDKIQFNIIYMGELYGKEESK